MYVCIAAVDEPTFQWSKQTSSADDDIKLTAHYLHGDNYTTADQFYWTLPDGSTLVPGNTTSTGVYEAMPAKVRIQSLLTHSPNTQCLPLALLHYSTAPTLNLRHRIFQTPSVSVHCR